MPGSGLEAQLVELIGEDAVVRLAESFGGTRLYVPVKIAGKHELARTIGLEAAQQLCARFSPDVIQVPLARDLRARHYAAAGQTHAQIARALGMTEKGAHRLIRRVRQEAEEAR